MELIPTPRMVTVFASGSGELPYRRVFLGMAAGTASGQENMAAREQPKRDLLIILEIFILRSTSVG